MSTRVGRRGRVCLPLAVAAILLTPSHSVAAANPIASGRTELQLGRHLLGQLEGVRGKVIPKGQAIAISSSTFVLAVAGGALDPTNGAGNLTLSDGIAIKRGRRAAGIRDITVETSAGFVVAKVGGKKMRLGIFKSVTSAREGFGVSISIGAVDLSGAAARKLNEVLHLDGRARLRGGQSFGSLAATTQPGAVELNPSSSDGSLATAEGYVAFDKLRAREAFFGRLVPLIPHYSYFPTYNGLPTAVTFYIPSVSGWIAPDGSSGEVELAGGIALEGWSRSPKPIVRVQRIVLNLADKTLSADLSREPVPLSVAGRTPILTATEGVSVEVDAAARTFSIHAPTLALSAAFAGALNETFQASPPPPSPEAILTAGDPLGDTRFKVVAR